MKRIVVISVSLFFSLALMAQQKHSVDVSGINEVKIINMPVDFQIQGVSGNQMTLESSYAESIPERAEGLKPLGLMEDNTGQGINVKKEGSVLYLNASTASLRGEDVILEVPSTLTLKIDNSSPFAGDIEIEDFQGAFEAKTLSQDIMMRNVTGPVVLNSTSGDIEIVFTSLDQNNPMSITTISSDVDLTIPAGEKATFSYSTVTGELYTDLDLELEQKEKEVPKRAEGLVPTFYSRGFNESRVAKLNGGGVKIKLGSVSGDFFLRKN